LQINSGGAIFANSPIYGASSLLQYNLTGGYTRNLEWTSDIATIGTTPGYPNNVQISNNTTLNYYRATNTGPKGINGNLIIDAGSSFSYGAITTGGALSVKGNVTNAGNISLCSSGTLGDDLKRINTFEKKLRVITGLEDINTKGPIYKSEKGESKESFTLDDLNSSLDLKFQEDFEDQPKFKELNI
jgi:hypothetical protein